MRELVLASRNVKKLAEMRELLAPAGLPLRSIADFSDVEPEETATTFVENALIKARHAAKVSGLPALADDSGIEVAALGGRPGVYSARYAGGHGDDAANNAKLLDAMREVPDSARSARFVAVLVLLRHAEDPVPLIAQGFWEGRILREPRGRHGFGYNPVFLDVASGLSAAEMTAEQKNARSHRAQAVAGLLAQLRAASRP